MRKTCSRRQDCSESRIPNPYQSTPRKHLSRSDEERSGRGKGAMIPSARRTNTAGMLREGLPSVPYHPDIPTSRCKDHSHALGIERPNSQMTPVEKQAATEEEIAARASLAKQKHARKASKMLGFRISLAGPKF